MIRREDVEDRRQTATKLAPQHTGEEIGEQERENKAEGEGQFRGDDDVVRRDVEQLADVVRQRRVVVEQRVAVAAAEVGHPAAGDLEVNDALVHLVDAHRLDVVLVAEVGGREQGPEQTEGQQQAEDDVPVFAQRFIVAAQGAGAACSFLGPGSWVLRWLYQYVSPEGTQGEDVLLLEGGVHLTRSAAPRGVAPFSNAPEWTRWLRHGVDPLGGAPAWTCSGRSGVDPFGCAPA